MIRQWKIGVVTTGVMNEIIVSASNFTDAKEMALRMTGADYVNSCSEVF